jgi:hypothetical protein
MGRIAALAGLFTFAGLVAACGPTSPPSFQPTDETPSGDEVEYDDPYVKPPLKPDEVYADSGAFAVGSRGKDAGNPSLPKDGGSDGALPDGSLGAPLGLCTNAPGPGDLTIVELMIASRTGAGDRGEWVEIVNNRDCTANLKGLRVESPRGSTGQDSVEITSDLLVPPAGRIVVADSADPQVNGGIPGTVIAFYNEPSDVLKNDGDDVTLSFGGAVVDSLSYPAMDATAGRSISFPSDCAAVHRSNWARWSMAFAGYGSRTMPDGGIAARGTPNSPNDDVACF